MSVSQEIKDFCSELGKESWDITTARNVPDTKSLTAKATGKKIEAAVVLYADIDGSTSMVDRYPAIFCAWIYKSYLYACGRIIRSKGGTIVAYDGDRVMAIYMGSDAADMAVKSALSINGFVEWMNSEKLKGGFVLKHSIGIDCSDLMASKTGIRDDNDIVWVGKAANHAAKLSDFPQESKSIKITKGLYGKLSSACILSKGENMWIDTKKFVYGDPVYASGYYYTEFSKQS